MPGVHAKLSASGSKRWMACPRSVALEENVPEKESEYAIEGTKAHEVAETILKLKLAGDCESLDEFHKKMQKEDRSMLDYVYEYINSCMDVYHEALMMSKNVVVFIEDKLDFSRWVPDGFGTGDFVMIFDNRIVIRDLKYGKGVPVSAKGNSQLRLYGLGALANYGWIYDINYIDMGICQPRLNSIEIEVLQTRDLLKWGTEIVIPKAKKANEDKGDYCAGEHCKFCRANSSCKHRAHSILSRIASILNGGKDD